MSNTGIYVVFSPTSKVYVGQSIDLFDRLRKYETLNCKHQRHLYNSIKKHGWTAHRFEVIFKMREDISQEMLTYWEQFFMDYYRSEGYELMNIREAGNKSRLTEETKRKLSVINTGEKHPMFGKTHSSTVRKRMSESKLGAKNPKFKGFITAYKNSTIVGVFEGGRDADRKLGFTEGTVEQKLNSNKPWKGFTFIREPLQKQDGLQ